MGFVRKRRLDAIKGGLERGEKGGGGGRRKVLVAWGFGDVEGFLSIG